MKHHEIMNFWEHDTHTELTNEEKCPVKKSVLPKLIKMYNIVEPRQCIRVVFTADKQLKDKESAR